MKQHISITDWSSLEYEKQIKLCDLLVKDINFTNLFQYHFVSMITIGKMIEILDNTNQDWCVGPESLDTGYRDENNDIIFRDCYMVDHCDGEIQFQDELCDALWEAIKVIL